VSTSGVSGDRFLALFDFGTEDEVLGLHDIGDRRVDFSLDRCVLRLKIE
jgi:hypothetical protein